MRQRLRGVLERNRQRVRERSRRMRHGFTRLPLFGSSVCRRGRLWRPGNASPCGNCVADGGTCGPAEVCCQSPAGCRDLNRDPAKLRRLQPCLSSPLLMSEQLQMQPRRRLQRWSPRYMLGRRVPVWRRALHVRAALLARWDLRLVRRSAPFLAGHSACPRAYRATAKALALRYSLGSARKRKSKEAITRRRKGAFL
jgi:hypothetical protein